MVRSKRQSTRKAWMIICVVVNLGMLGYFKYGEFLLANFVTLTASLGVDYRPPEWNIVLPVGISFYTFATLSYTLDVYLRRAKPAKQLPRLRFVRDLLPAPRRGADHAPDRARPAVRRSRAAPPRTSSISASR